MCPPNGYLLEGPAQTLNTLIRRVYPPLLSPPLPTQFHRAAYSFRSCTQLLLMRYAHCLTTTKGRAPFAFPALHTPRFQAKRFDELTLRELQQIQITRSLVFTVGQQILAQEPDEADFESVHFFHADESGRILAYLRLFDLMTVDDGYHRPIEGAWTLGRVAVREEARGTGLGRALLSEAIEWVKENTDARQLVISAQSYLKDSYYGAAGFVQVGEPYLEVGIEHVEMILKL